MATVQDYIDFAMSLKIGNRSMTDVSLSLPDDFRRFSDLKVKSIAARTVTVAGGDAVHINRKQTADSICVVFCSHPVRVTRVNNDTLADPFYVSFFATGRNSAGTASFDDPVLTIDNDLHTPTYTTTSGGATTDVDIYALNIELVT